MKQMIFIEKVESLNMIYVIQNIQILVENQQV